MGNFKSAILSIRARQVFQGQGVTPPRMRVEDIPWQSETLHRHLQEMEQDQSDHINQLQLTLWRTLTHAFPYANHM